MSAYEPAALETVAPDARPLIAAFREAGSISFQHRTVADARALYVASCQANAPQHPRAVHTTQHAVPLGPQVRVYRPEDSAQPAPAVLFFHGGGWVIGDLESHDGLCRYLAAKAGAVVVAVDYRLAPEHPYPAAHDDAERAARWLFDNAAALHIDPERIAVVGDSAGASLATWAARLAANGAVNGAFCAQVLLYPVTDLTMSSESYQRVRAGFPLTADSMHWFADAYAPPSARTDAALSPSLHPTPPMMAPAFVLTVGHDPLADEGIRYAANLAHAGIPVEHHHLPTYAHGLVTSAGRIPRGMRVLDRVADYICEHTAPRVLQGDVE